MSIELNFAGKKYISLKRAGLIAGYAGDYVGQLCRQGKVGGRLVGRGWFVDLDDLLKYKNAQEEMNRVNSLLYAQNITLRTEENKVSNSRSQDTQDCGPDSWVKDIALSLTVFLMFCFLSFGFYGFKNFEKKLNGTVDNISQNIVLGGKIFFKGAEDRIELLGINIGNIAGSFFGINQAENRNILSANQYEQGNGGYFIVVREESYDFSFPIFVTVIFLASGLMVNVYIRYRAHNRFRALNEF